MNTDPRDFWGEPIHVYTRAQALADGVLVDVTETAREVGFRVPVALTASVWADVREIPVAQKGIQDPEGRLWDLLHMGRIAAGRSLDAHTIIYRLRMDHLCGPPGEARHRTRRIYKAKLHVGPGDHGECVVTIMQPNED